MKNIFLKSARLAALGMMMGSALNLSTYAGDLELEDTFNPVPSNPPSKQESVWKAHGFSLKKQGPILTQEDLASLFSTGFVVGKNRGPWRLEGNLEKPSEIMDHIAPTVSPKPIWVKDESCPLICTRQDENIIEYVTELTFIGDELFPWLYYEKVPYRLVLIKTRTMEERD